jgi:hypothetical protein
LRPPELATASKTADGFCGNSRTTGKPKQGELPARLEAYKWKPGESGNLRGRPRTKPLTDEIKKLLDQFAKEKRLRVLEPIMKNPTYSRLLAKALVLRAIVSIKLLQMSG